MSERFLPRHHRGRGRFWALTGPAVIALGLTGLASEPLAPPGTIFYSTAVPPVDCDGPRPAETVAPTQEPAAAPAAPAAGLADIARPAAPEPKIAAMPAADRVNPALPRKPALPGEKSVASAAADPIATALRMIAECKDRYQQVRDFSCTFHKRERINGRLSQPHVMAMKMRTQPFSVYFKFARPNAGREAIYIAGRNNGKAVVHDVGLGKVLAGTMHLDPKGSMAMEDNLHPITDAGIGHLIDTVATHWKAEMKHGETLVTIQEGAHVNARPCTMIESVHPQKHKNYLFHAVKVYIDQELGVPIRFEAYDWPHRPGEKPELVEEYTYLDLKLNVGLHDDDFDPKNKAYSYGRF